ncbi:hypothetical protein [Sulfurisphaera tokodaii]|uniref:Uncharacterized protein n=2 Tax=Sulfurisphaera tokodaii TaxID=111955 RepID=Q96XX9_SULTO|nr:hypothetical protein [Sulfurisphaera tokodaii]BAB67498.1 hypothetical protein STK_23890 [Sulfurisphaera tokodaii str. 7]HII75208.1 hypothetical protein [Sulfurisphaera tokodaii]
MKRVIGIFLCLFSLIGYFVSFHYLLLGSTITLTFWLGLWLLIPKKFFDLTWNIKKGRGYWISFSLYLLFHLLLYGFFYYIILGAFIYLPIYSIYVDASITPTIQYFLYWIANSPAIGIIIAGYEMGIFPFTTFIGILLALLIGANIEKILKLKNLLNAYKRSTALIAIPTLGVVSGTSCCLSLPSLIIYFVALDIGVISSVLPILASPIYFGFAWYGLPISSVLILLFNLKDLNKVVNKLESSKCEIRKENTS